MVVPPHTTRIGQHLPDPHHASEPVPEQELEPELHSGEIGSKNDEDAEDDSKKLAKFVIGQQKAKKVLAVAVYNHYKGYTIPSRKTS
ncbi:hypothetical protein PVK06_002712 [Gossypium arboreum]|uniref:Uncharacterized protein n=1 Tax=Gossypium arboreum TaxID=29729 RepID=A0ABR0R4J2_GOSAR|nr:hypothetical protein PVK06_002712 [Gossypium arboreum]